MLNIDLNGTKFAVNMIIFWYIDMRQLTKLSYCEILQIVVQIYRS